MIQNLNRLSFQSFGTILPEIPEQTGWQQPWKTVFLNISAAPAWKAASDTWLSCESGMAVLSISDDGEHYRDVYMDKAVKVRSGIYFSICAFQEQALVRFASPVTPLSLPDRDPKADLHICRKLNIEKIYTLFYQEKEQGFLFSGESHPILELTYVDQGSMHSVVEGQDILLKQGDLVIYGANQWHMQYADIGVAPRFVTITFDISAGDLTPLLNRKFTAPQHTVALLQQMLQEQEKMDAFVTAVTTE